MINKLLYIFLILILNIITSSSIYATEVFNFDVTEVEITEEGNKFIGKNGGTATSDDGTVIKANKIEDLGGHISTYSSAATLYEVGFNNFYRGSDNKPGDMIYFQGHSSPGIYARSFLEGSITAQKLNHFRQEIDGNGLSSYPHPWLMSDYWQLPTVSMGLGPIMAIYQAHIMKYLEQRGLLQNEPKRKIWTHN